MCRNFSEKVANPLSQRYQEDEENSHLKLLVLTQIDAEFSKQKDEELPRPLHITNICKKPDATQDLIEDVLKDITDLIKSCNLSDFEDYEFSLANEYWSERFFIVVFKKAD